MIDSKNIVSDLIAIVGVRDVVCQEEKLYHYARDHSTQENTFPICVVRPNTTKEVAEVVRYCNEKKLDITVRGGGSGVSGGCISSEKGIILSTEKLNKIISVDVINRLAIVESGVMTQQLQDELLIKNLMFPQNISSASLSYIGGNVAISSGSPKSLKYGTTKNYVINLEVVLPDGQIIWTGKNVEKNATGYNLTQLFVGSEGTLGIITKVVLKIVPVQKELLMMVPFEKSEKLFGFVEEFFQQGLNATSLEFLDKNGSKLVLDYLDEKDKFTLPLSGLLWIEFESPTDEENIKKAEKVYGLIANYTENDPMIAQSDKDIASLWKYRKKIGEAAINLGVFKDLDIVVPRDKIALMFAEIKAICTSFKLDFIVVGHIGNGNFHINVFNNKEQEWEDVISKCTQLIFKKSIELGGEISGEHGIGRYNRSFFNQLTPKTNTALMSAIKKVFDPNNILNNNNLFN